MGGRNRADQAYFRLANTVGVTVVLLSIMSLNCFGQSNSAKSKPSIPVPNNQNEAISDKHRAYLIEDEAGHSVHPIAVRRAGEDIYFLGPDCIWFCAGAKPVMGGEDILVLKRIAPSGGKQMAIPWQEFNDFIYLPAKKSLVILDKSGDLFEYNPASSSWSTFRTNFPTTGAPDPDYIAFCSLGDRVALLDPERNQIWCGTKGKLATYFKEVLPWRIKYGQPNVSDGIAIDFSQHTYVLKRDGRITICEGLPPSQVHERVYPYHRPADMRPSRLVADGSHELYIVERENNRVLKVDTVSGACLSFIFPQNSDLRGMVPSGDGFWIIDGGQLHHECATDAVSKSGKIYPHRLDARLQGLILPIQGQRLPGHPGVFPGARRLYRYGVHQGLDMFNNPGSGSVITMGTPVRAAQAGRIIRADANFQDMNVARFNRVMAECRTQHRTSPENEDLFRGCQVWIDHGHGLATHYAHLNKINPTLKLGAMVARGDLIGFVGISGTGENLPGKIGYPHLHFEIWLDGKYLGWGLTPAETIGVYEDIFAHVNR